MSHIKDYLLFYLKKLS